MHHPLLHGVLRPEYDDTDRRSGPCGPDRCNPAVLQCSQPERHALARHVQGWVGTAAPAAHWPSQPDSGQVRWTGAKGANGAESVEDADSLHHGHKRIEQGA